MRQLTVVDSQLAPAASCVVCGNHIPAGEGVTATYGERTLRFEWSGCAARFEADPDRYLQGHQAGCCGQRAEDSPASEWRCD